MINTTTHDEAATQLRRGLNRLARIEGFPVAIGGTVAPGGHRLVLGELHGLRTKLLRGG